MCDWQQLVRSRFKKCPNYNNELTGTRTILSVLPQKTEIVNDKFGNKIIQGLKKDKFEEVEDHTIFYHPSMDADHTPKEYELISYSGSYSKRKERLNPEIIEPCWRERFR